MEEIDEVDVESDTAGGGAGFEERQVPEVPGVWLVSLWVRSGVRSLRGVWRGDVNECEIKGPC